MFNNWKPRLSAVLCSAMVMSSLFGVGWTGISKTEAASLTSYKFDFGSSASPVALGYNQVTNTTIYSADLGYGLDKTVNVRDRGGPDPLLGDFVLNSNFTFMVDVPNGDYVVKLTAGDAIASNKTTVAIEGVSYGTLTSSSGNYSSLEQSIHLTDGQLTFQLSGDGRVNAIDIIPAAAPTGLVASNITYGVTPSVTLMWNAVNGAAGYNVYRSGGDDDHFTLVGSSVYTSYTDTTAGLGDTYQYKVTQLTSEGIESIAGTPVTVTVKDPSVPVPSAPNGISLAGSAKDQLRIRWNSVDDALLYHIFRAKKQDGPFVRVGTSTTPEYTDNDVFTTIPYYYKVAAVNNGGLSAQSDLFTVPIQTVLYRQAETLDRSPVAVKVDGGVYIGWRLLGTDPADITFNVYRNDQRVTTIPATGATNWLDSAGTSSDRYEVRAVMNGKEETKSETFAVWNQNYTDVPLLKPDGGVTPDGVAYTYRANDTSIGDVDGDGKYELIVKWDPSNSKDNSQSGYTGNVYIDAYKLDGTRLWRIDLGRNIRAGAHYTQFMVYDLDGDGKAEVMFKTADGTIDGTGQMIGDPNADYRNSSGYILSGPEYLTVFEGATGKALATVNYDPPRGNVADWGDSYGNRVDRFLAGVAYLDGERPSVIFARGYYTRTVLAAYNWRDGQLTEVWKFDSKQPGYGDYVAQGNHQLSVADVDRDGKDEIVYGAMTIDDNGKPLYNTGFGHGDALHVGDLNPDHPGLEVYKVDEHTDSPYGAVEYDAETGEMIWGQWTGADTGRGMSADIDPRYLGEEQWASNGVGLYSAQGQKLGSKTPSINFGIWWDGDLLRELLDQYFDSSVDAGVPKIDKWDYLNNRSVNVFTANGTYTNNSTKGTPNLQADLFGDWREEVVARTEDSSALRIYTTTDMTDNRLYTLMDDPQYRLAVAWQNVGYNQPPHPGFYLGEGMSTPLAPKLKRTPASTVTGNTVDQYAIPNDQGAVVVDVDASKLQQAIDDTDDHTVTVNLHEVPEADSVQLNLPASVVFTAEEHSINRISVNSGIAQLAIDPNLFKRQNIDHSETVGYVQVTTAVTETAGHPVYQFGLRVDGKAIHGFGDDLQVTVPYTLHEGEDANKIVIYVMDDGGIIHEIKNGVYDPVSGTVTFKAANF